ncbi:Predicted oxidoreductase [Tistlia consotensis]|uniref:Predicted oxidoreductase n=1 Tax=Tistlia consotensis USBA 355 TaxID=560819 RepID=A0A1Y6B4G8_9PROT|nr:Predicted oxidoreductase [Tistlia consotensis USBA 355]SNR25490.1 Predicted oxidoreductase [Tistlia consotensis]
MKYRRLGESGLRVSRLCLGTMMFGLRTEVAEAERIVADATEAGVNFIDTADQYADGESERITGRAIAARRHDWVLATKVCNPMGQDVNRRGLGRKWILQACDESLTRLGSDYIDVYYMHKEDIGTPLEESVRAMADLIAAGKVRYFALSNFRAWRLAEICNLCDQAGIDRPVALQPYYNAFNRMPEVELLPACDHYGLGVVPYSPMARGVLSGKYDPDSAPPSGSRAGAQDTRMMQTEWRRESLVLARQVLAHAEKRGVTAGQFATAWVLNNRFVSSVIAGPRTFEQWRDYLGALDFAFTAEDEALIDGMVSPGHPSTPGYNDPAYPIEGRPTYTAAPG